MNTQPRNMPNTVGRSVYNGGATRKQKRMMRKEWGEEEEGL
jgi:hypothetical protein